MIRYPTCLVYLSMIQQELFRNRLGDIGFVQELARIGTRHHETWYVLCLPAMTDFVLTIRRVEKAPTASKQEQDEKPNGIALAS